MRDFLIKDRLDIAWKKRMAMRNLANKMSIKSDRMYDRAEPTTTLNRALLQSKANQLWSESYRKRNIADLAFFKSAVRLLRGRRIKIIELQSTERCGCYLKLSNGMTFRGK